MKLTITKHTLQVFNFINRNMDKASALVYEFGLIS